MGSVRRLVLLLAWTIVLKRLKVALLLPIDYYFLRRYLLIMIILGFIGSSLATLFDWYVNLRLNSLLEISLVISDRDAWLTLVYRRLVKSPGELFLVWGCTMVSKDRLDVLKILKMALPVGCRKRLTWRWELVEVYLRIDLLSYKFLFLSRWVTRSWSMGI